MDQWNANKSNQIKKSKRIYVHILCGIQIFQPHKLFYYVGVHNMEEQP